MRRTRITRLSGLCLLAVSCSQPTPSFTEADRAAVRDSVTVALDDFRRYAAAAEWDSLAAFYSDSPGFRFLESGEIRYRSAEDIRTGLKSLPPGMSIETTYEDSAIDGIAPGLAVVTSLFRTSFADPTGVLFGFNGAVSMFWSHEPEGWRIRSGHSSVPVPRGQ